MKCRFPSHDFSQTTELMSHDEIGEMNDDKLVKLFVDFCLR